MFKILAFLLVFGRHLIYLIGSIMCYLFIEPVIGFPDPKGKTDGTKKNNNNNNKNISGENITPPIVPFFVMLPDYAQIERVLIHD